MATRSEVKVACPACKTTYWFPIPALGQTVTCRKCSGRFTAEYRSPKNISLMIAKLSLENKLVSAENLQKALPIQKAIQAKIGMPYPLEEVLVKKGMITSETKENLLVAATRQMDKSFCKAAVSKKAISQETAGQALKEQAIRYRESRERILVGEILVARGALSEEVCNEILQAQGRIERVRTTTSEPEAAAASFQKAGGEETADVSDKSAPEAAAAGQETPAKQAAASEAEKPVQELSEGDTEKIGVLKDKKFFQIRNLDKEFGKMVIAENLATRGEVHRALELQLQTFQDKGLRVLIGDLLIEDGILTTEQRDAALYRQNRQASAKTFEQLAVEKGYLTQEGAEKAQRALQEQEKEAGGAISDILIEMGLITTEQRDEIVQSQADALRQSEDADELDAKVFEAALAGVDFEITISKNGLRAYLKRKTTVPEQVDVDDIKDLLMDHDVVYGLVDDTLIEGFLRFDGYLDKKFAVAQGKPPKAGRPGRIKYHFDTAYRKAGAMGEDGQIDFKDRGEIPHVKAGTLLAEKIPMLEGEQGIDVHGHPIQLEDVRDISLKAGPGVELFEDGYRAVAATDGQPDASFGGRVSVLSEYKIDGDVGYETGHVDFDGNVIVNGIVKSGFRVRACDLTANEIQEAEIVLTGDLLVKGGITDATISLQGDLKAKYLKNATIAAYGDVFIEKEVIDCRIETSGMCIVKSGKIISSEIAAKKGVQAKQIGTDLSAPNTFWVGVDTHMDKEIEKIATRIGSLKEEKKALQDKDLEWVEADTKLQVDIAHHAHIQDRSLVEKRDLEKQLEEASGKLGPEQVEKIRKTVQQLDEKAKTADEMVTQLFEKQDQLGAAKQKTRERLDEIDRQIGELKDERQEKMSWARKQSADAAVAVSSEIYEGTRVFGRSAKVVLKKDYKRAKIYEIRVGTKGDAGDWKMKIDS